MIRIIFCGNTGKMGRFLIKNLNKNSFEIVGVVNDKTLALDELLNSVKCDVIVDFTNAQICYQNAIISITKNIPFVSGTTNLSNDMITHIKSLSKKHKCGVIICPNYTIGINYIRKWIKDINFDSLNIVEKHHISKLDSPSGTAKMLGNIFGKNVTYKSYRLKRKCAEHKLVFNDGNEELIIHHKVLKKHAYIKLIEAAIIESLKINCYKDIVGGN